MFVQEVAFVPHSGTVLSCLRSKKDIRCLPQLADLAHWKVSHRKLLCYFHLPNYSTPCVCSIMCSSPTHEEGHLAIWRCGAVTVPRLYSSANMCCHSFNTSSPYTANNCAVSPLEVEGQCLRDHRPCTNQKVHRTTNCSEITDRQPRRVRLLAMNNKKEIKLCPGQIPPSPFVESTSNEVCGMMLDVGRRILCFHLFSPHASFQNRKQTLLGWRGTKGGGTTMTGEQNRGLPSTLKVPGYLSINRTN